MRPSTHFLGIIKEMVHAKLLDEFSAPKNGRYNRHVYMLPKSSYTSPPKKSRSIPINANGKKIDQLELWS